MGDAKRQCLRVIIIIEQKNSEVDGRGGGGRKRGQHDLTGGYLTSLFFTSPQMGSSSLSCDSLSFMLKKKFPF